MFLRKHFRKKAKKHSQYTAGHILTKKPPYLEQKKAHTCQQSAIQAHLYTNCTGDVKKPRRFHPK